MRLLENLLNESSHEIIHRVSRNILKWSLPVTSTESIGEDLMKYTSIIRFLMVVCPVILMSLVISHAVFTGMNYQGVVENRDGPFTGTGQFMFAFVDDSGRYLWSNDNVFPPTTILDIEVVDGLYEVVLGYDLGMRPITHSVFDPPEVYLRIWFDDGLSGMEQFSPDKLISSVGYAFKSEEAAVALTADDADTVDGNHYSSNWPTTLSTVKTAVSNDFHNIGGIDDDVPDSDAEVPDHISISNTGLYAPAGGPNVGIGTTTPAGKLTVAGSILRSGSSLLGTNTDHFINLGVSSTAGTDGQADNYITIGGGGNNTATGTNGTISGGYGNYAAGGRATVGGGYDNAADGYQATISGGGSNTATGGSITIAGGINNTATQPMAVISGGSQNNADATGAVIAGGYDHAISGMYSNISGGYQSAITGEYTSISGGFSNSAVGDYAFIAGGRDNENGGDYSWVGGRNMRLSTAADRTFLWGYSDTMLSVSEPDTFVVYSGNMGVGTTSPSEKLEVTGTVYSSTGGFKFPDATVQTTAAASSETRTPIATIPYTISTSGSYYLTQNLEHTGSDIGIYIDANFVTLDLNGFTISGDQTTSSDGVYVNYKSCVTVKNGIIFNFDYGIYFFGTSSSVGYLAENVQVINCAGAGIWLNGSGNEIRKCNISLCQGNGITDNGYGSMFRGNTIIDNDGNGIISANYASFIDNLITYNDLAGIEPTGNSFFDGNLVYSNGGSTYPNIGTCTSCTYGVNHAP